MVFMIIFKRGIEEEIKKTLFKNRMVIILGPRQSGKTTLSISLIKEYGDSGVYYDCQLAEVRDHFIVGRPEKLLPLTKGKKIVVFDEAQTIQDIGSILKVYHDTYPGVQIIATGSSSFDLSNKIKEPMTGRANEFLLLPLSLREISKTFTKIKKQDLYDLLQFGSYPAVVGSMTKEEKARSIKNIATNYLYKDIFTFETIRSPRVFENMLKMLAYQVGSLVSLNELANALDISRATVNKYLRLLEQSFIIRIVYSFSSNYRNEIKKSFKVFFLDIGVRNAIVDINTPLDDRDDKGAIFENFFINEKLKNGSIEVFPPEVMFWRDRAGNEIDVIEKSGQKINAFECKWNSTTYVPPAFKKKYPKAIFQTVNIENILDNI
jgi:uncharacterized protein